jgi:Rieske Fe-S protein
VCKGACAAALLVACQPGGGDHMVETGDLSDAGTAPPTPDAGPRTPDAGQRDGGPRPIDGAVAQPDAAPMGADCPSGVTSVGAASSFVDGSPTYFSNGRFFVVRDAAGLYAMTAICTHAGCVTQKRNSTFYCPCHRATFSMNGDAVSGPVFSPLVHYAMCSMGNGMVGVNTRQTVAASTRLAA